MTFLPNLELNGPVCLCVAVLTKYFDDNGTIESQYNTNLSIGNLLSTPRTQFTKDVLRRQSLLLDKYCPQARPPRVMMNELNRFFMTPVNLQSKEVRDAWNKQDKGIQHEQT